MNLNKKGVNLNLRCKYHLNTQGHSMKNSWTLEKAIEKLIESKVIMIQREKPPNITNNTLPNHNNAYVVGMIYNDSDHQ